MAQVDEAEKEASEVLHSLLSVERIEKTEVILENNENQTSPSQTFQTNQQSGNDVENETQMQWQGPVTLAAHSIFSTIDGNNHFQTNQIEDQQVIWEGHTIQVDNSNQLNTIYTTSAIEETSPVTKRQNTNNNKSRTPPKSTKPKKPALKKKKKTLVDSSSGENDSTKMEESAAQVKQRFKRGCECQDESCFRGLNPESVYKHRLNIAELTKGEHDMYLMGVTMACLANPDTTVRHKERRRLRAQYVYQGRRVCLDAFLYLENCTHYQLKRIRKHVMTHGVAPRVHGNHGKKPHNTFPLDIYYHATEFLKQYLEQYTGERDIVNTKQSIQLPWDVTRKNLHDAYKEYGQILEPGIKLMGYSTFRHFMKEQFPHVKFCKIESKPTIPQQGQQQQSQQNQSVQQQTQQQQPETTQLHQHTIQKTEILERPRDQPIQKCVINNEVIPLVVAPNDGTGGQHHQQAFLVTPVSQLIPNGSQNPNGHTTTNAYSYQLTNAGYVINEQDQSVSPSEEIEMVNTICQEPLGLNDVAELLNSQYAIISGGKSKEGCPIITFPDNNNFHLLNDEEYQRLMLYLTSVPSLQEADLGFHLIIDRRKDRWNSVKTVLLKISVYFPGLIHVVYVIRPASFLQKALSEVSNKLFKDEFKFRMIVLSTIEELHEYVDLTQLTPDLGGTLEYSHQEWMQQRIELEKFSIVTQQVSNALDKFTKTIDESELPNTVDLIQQLLNRETLDYAELKEEILSAARHGEKLLSNIKNKFDGDNTPTIPTYSCDTVGNVFAVERLLVQLEETERTFDDFWQQHSAKLRHCLELRRFEQDFRELQINFNSHIKVVSEMNEIGDSVARIDNLLKDTIAFEKLCLVDTERAEEVVSSGQHLIQNKNFYPLQCVEPKCCEIIRMRENLTEKLLKRKEILAQSREIMESVEIANDWCTKGLDLLATHKIEKCPPPEVAEKYILEVEEFLKTSDNLLGKNPLELNNLELISSEIKMLVAQVVPKIAEISQMCEKRLSALRVLATPPPKADTPVPRQPIGGAPCPNRAILKKTCKIPKSQSTDKYIETEVPPTLSGESDETSNVKTGHVLTELIETERVYVSELLSVITGYKMATKSEEMQHLVTPGLSDKMDGIFGNLEEIYSFHSSIFLKDLENCISSIDLVALCFVQRRDSFFRLYSYYCQNIPRSEQLRETLVDSNMFFQTCQRKLGHKLPLAAYLLKPVQRITKYQLLLKDLLRYSKEGKCCKELQQALDCMLVVLKCVNDSMHQISITGFPVDLSQQGDLLLQGSFSVWVENKKDLRLRLKPMRRHIFLYQKSILFCKSVLKTTHHNKATYQFKHYLKMSQIGLTESVKGDARKFEVWLQGRQEVHTIQAANIDQKQTWVNEIKRVLLNQLEELKGEKIKQYTALAHKPLHRQTTSWEKQKNVPNVALINNHRSMSCDTESQQPHHFVDDSLELEAENWSSDCSNSDEEDHQNNSAVPSGRYIALADYCAIGNSEVTMREGDMVELLKVGCAGWWFIKVIGSSSIEGWAPAAYLENLHRKTSRSSSKSQDKLNDH